MPSRQKTLISPTETILDFVRSLNTPLLKSSAFSAIFKVLCKFSEIGLSKKLEDLVFKYLALLCLQKEQIPE